MSILPLPKADYGFFNDYVSLAPGTDLITAFKENIDHITGFANTISDDKLLYRYGADKWNIKEVFAHLIDAERNFCYRSMRISRGEQTPVPPFDVYNFVVNSFASEREMTSIMDELSTFRKATVAMYEGMHPAMLDRTGPARDTVISVRALGFATIGHTIHHINIIKERYLN